MFERVLILSPHTDDGEISIGGSINRFVDEGKDVYYVAFSSCEESVPECYRKDILKTECLNATQELGIKRNNVTLLNYEVRKFPAFRQEILDDMIAIKKDVHPDLVITPSSFDTHQDHQVVYSESLRAFKKRSSLWGMDHPWNNLTFRTDIFIELNEKNVHKKIDALKKYNSQSFKSYFEEDYIKAYAHTCGTIIDKKYAEVFECIREIRHI